MTPNAASSSTSYQSLLFHLLHVRYILLSTISFHHIKHRRHSHIAKSRSGRPERDRGFLETFPSSYSAQGKSAAHPSDSGFIDERARRDLRTDIPIERYQVPPSLKLQETKLWGKPARGTSSTRSYGQTTKLKIPLQHVRQFQLGYEPDPSSYCFTSPDKPFYGLAKRSQWCSTVDTTSSSCSTISFIAHTI